MKIGNAIKTLRKNKGLTQGEFCDMVGITQSYLSLIENGIKDPSMDVIKKVASSLKTPVAVLFWFTLTEEDVDESKVEAFRILKPCVDRLVNSLFNPSI